jgi:hypothetical protein
MALEITKGTTVPATVSTRTREENPFAGMFPTPPEGEGVTLIVELPSETDEEKKYVAKVASQAQTAARESVDAEHPDGYTARVKREGFVKGSGKSAKNYTRLTIWSVDRIYRKGAGRKPAAQVTPEA